MWLGCTKDQSAVGQYSCVQDLVDVGLAEATATDDRGEQV